MKYTHTTAGVLLMAIELSIVYILSFIKVTLLPILTLIKSTRTVEKTHDSFLTVTIFERSIEPKFCRVKENTDKGLT